MVIIKYSKMELTMRINNWHYDITEEGTQMHHNQSSHGHSSCKGLGKCSKSPHCLILDWLEFRLQNEPWIRPLFYFPELHWFHLLTCISWPNDDSLQFWAIRLVMTRAHSFPRQNLTNSAANLVNSVAHRGKADEILQLTTDTQLNFRDLIKSWIDRSNTCYELMNPSLFIH